MLSEYTKHVHFNLAYFGVIFATASFLLLRLA